MEAIVFSCYLISATATAFAIILTLNKGRRRGR